MDTKWLIVKLINTAGVKVLAAISLLLSTLAVTHLLPEAEAGIFLYGLSFLSFAIPFFTLGLEGAILKIFSINDDQVYRSKVLVTSFVWISIATLPFCLLVNLLPLSNMFMIKQSGAFDVVPYLAWCIPLGSLCLMVSASFQSVHKVNSATFLQNLGVTFFFLMLLLPVYLFDLSISGIEAAELYLMSTLIVTVLALFMVKYSFLSKDIDININIKNSSIWSISSNFWAASAMNLTIQWGGILIAGFYVEPEELAHLAAAFRVAALTSFILTIVNMVVAPRFAKLWSEGKYAETEHLAKMSVRCMTALVTPVVIIIFVFPSQIMSLFGEGYKSASLLLIVLTIGQFINVSTGSVGYLLSMSGHEKDYRNVVLISSPLTFLLSYLLVVQLGGLGAAIATAVGLSVQNIGALIMVRKRLGFWPIG